MKRLRAVLFDLDGTLLDTAPDFAAVLDQMLAHRSRDPLPFSAVRESVSNGAAALITLAFGVGPGEPGFGELREELLSLYEIHLADRTRPFEGIEQVLAELETNGIRWGIATNKPVRYTELLLKRLGLNKRSAVTICPEHVRNRKPHPEPVIRACRLLDCHPADAVYVGDHRRDIASGRLAGVTTIAAAYGYVHPNDPVAGWGADMVINSAIELVDRLEWPARTTNQ